MPRATESDVRKILPASTQLTSDQINMAIISANCVVDQIAAGCASHLSEACLTQIEIYLSAHYCAATENSLTLKSEKDGCSDSSVVYGFQFGEGVKGTPFGQMANTMSGGCLAEMDKQPVRFLSIGTVGC